MAQLDSAVPSAAKIQSGRRASNRDVGHAGGSTAHADMLPARLPTACEECHGGCVAAGCGSKRACCSGGGGELAGMKSAAGGSASLESTAARWVVLSGARASWGSSSRPTRSSSSNSTRLMCSSIPMRPAPRCRPSGRTAVGSGTNPDTRGPTSSRVEVTRHHTAASPRRLYLRGTNYRQATVEYQSCRQHRASIRPCCVHGSVARRVSHERLKPADPRLIFGGRCWRCARACN